MFRSTNVPFDECSVRRMFRSTNVPFDQCSIWPMFHSTNVPFDQCSIRPMFLRRKCIRRKCLRRKYPNPTRVHPSVAPKTRLSKRIKWQTLPSQWTGFFSMSLRTHFILMFFMLKLHLQINWSCQFKNFLKGLIASKFNKSVTHAHSGDTSRFLHNFKQRRCWAKKVGNNLKNFGKPPLKNIFSISK